MTETAELERLDLRPVSDEDLYRAWLRSEYNRSRGKRGAWARARHVVKVPRWFLDRLTRRDGIQR